MGWQMEEKTDDPRSLSLSDELWRNWQCQPENTWTCYPCVAPHTTPPVLLTSFQSTFVHNKCAYFLKGAIVVQKVKTSSFLILFFLVVTPVFHPYLSCLLCCLTSDLSVLAVSLHISSDIPESKNVNVSNQLTLIYWPEKKKTKIWYMFLTGKINELDSVLTYHWILMESSWGIKYWYKSNHHGLDLSLSFVRADSVIQITTSCSKELFTFLFLHQSFFSSQIETTIFLFLGAGNSIASFPAKKGTPFFS